VLSLYYIYPRPPTPNPQPSTLKSLNVAAQVHAVYDRTCQRLRKRWALLSKKPVVQRVFKVASLVQKKLRIVVVAPNSALQCGPVLERDLPEKTYLDAAMTSVTVIQVGAMCWKHPGLNATEVLAMEIIDSVCIWWFFVELLVKLGAYGDPRCYLALKVNVFDLLVTTISVVAWIIEGQDESESAHALSAVRIMRIARILTLARYWPEIYQLLTETVRDSKHVFAAVFVVVFAWMTYALIGQQCFEGTLLPPAVFPEGEQHLAAMGFFAYFDSLAGAMFAVVMLLTGSSMTTTIVHADHSPAGKALVVYLLLGGVILELVIMKAFLAVLIDNFELPDKQKVLIQIYDSDRQARIREEGKRRALVAKQLMAQNECQFQEYNFSKKIDPVGGEPSAQADCKTVMRGWAFWCLHSQDAPGKRVWLELLENCLLTCWGVSWNGRQWVRTGVEVTIPIRNALVLRQSQARVRSAAQAGALSLVLRADCSDPHNVNITFVHLEHVLWLPSRAAVREWVEAFRLFGAFVRREVLALRDETSDKTFGWDALINRPAGMGFDDAVDEESVPPPDPLPAQAATAGSRPLRKRAELVVLAMIDNVRGGQVIVRVIVTDRS
jgi:hypothetical protein